MLNDTDKRRLQWAQAKADDRASTPAEVAEARGLFSKLCLKYGLTAEDAVGLVDEADVDTEVIECAEPLFQQRSMVNWKYRLAKAIGDIYGVFFWQGRKVQGLTSLQMAGTEHGLASTRYLFALLLGDVERLSKQYCRGTSRTWGNNFRHGVVDALEKALVTAYSEAKAELAAENNTRALIRLTDAVALKKEAQALASRKHNLRTAASSSRLNEDARATGRRAGQSVNVRPSHRGLLT